MNRVVVEVFLNNTKTHEFCFHNLLDGLVYIHREGLKFDYIIVDEETVEYSEFNGYLVSVNEFCRDMYGSWYENLDVA